MKLRIILWMLVVLVILGLSGDAHAEGLDLFQQKKYGYILRVSRTASYQLLPGDYLQVGVLSGPSHARAAETVIKRAQVIRIHESAGHTASLVLALNRKEVRLMQKALAKPQTSVTLRLVKKQPRQKPAGAFPSPDDVLPD